MPIKGRLIFIFLLLFTMYLIQCGDGPTKQNEFLDYVNKAPDTFISAKTLTKVEIGTDESGNPTNVNTFAFTVSFSGTDVDGNIKDFTYKIDGGSAVTTTKQTISGTFEIVSATDVHNFSVFATDDRGKSDPTPAKAEFSLKEIDVNKAPNTSFDSAPVNGSEVGQGFVISFSGDDSDGMVKKFKYSIDGGDPVEIDADADGKASVEFSVANSNTFAAGNHSFSVTSIDNYGAEDESPTAVSFSVVAGFKPVIQFTAGPADGGLWFSNVDAVFSYNAVMSHYFGKLDPNGWAYSFDGADFTDFAPEGSAFILGTLVGDGAHSMVVRAKDLSGATGEATINFTSAAASFAKDLVLIDDNNFSETHNRDEFRALFASAGHPVDAYWDVGGDHDASEVDGSGSGIWSPGVLGQYKTIVIWTDASPTAASNEGILGAYVKAGGNILMTTYGWGNFTSGFLSATLGVVSLYGSSSGLHLGVDDTWDHSTSWSPRINTALAGLSFANSSSGSASLLRVANEENVFAVLRGGEGSSDLRYPRGVFKDGSASEGNTLSVGHSFRRIQKSPDPMPMIKGMMDLLTKDN